MLRLVALASLVALSGCTRTVEIVLAPTVLPPSAREPEGYGVVTAWPRYVDGRRDGVHLGDIVPGSLADELGLRAGDVLVELDGLPCDTLERCRLGAWRVERAMTLRRAFELAIERDGRRTRMRYRFLRFSPLAM